MKIKYFAAYDDTGAIIGLYNSVDHKTIPIQAVEITVEERNEIVCTPGAFSVENFRLKRDAVRLSNIDSDTSAKNRYKIRINKGVYYKGITYSASVEASAHITQCLVLIQLDEAFIPELLVLEKIAERYFVAVDKETLIEVAKQVNKIRLGAAIDLNYELDNRGV